MYTKLQLFKMLTSGASIFIGLFAAFLWWKASIVEIPVEEQSNTDGVLPAQISVVSINGKEIDPFKTASEQSKWNKWAAQASAGAAFLQAIVWMLPD
ncbi:MAG: hypothetical protein K2Y28_09050 [Burkholderiaceae bacterium]|nr:hypothetical protein [Burkholderiaceae bacterium]